MDYADFQDVSFIKRKKYDNIGFESAIVSEHSRNNCAQYRPPRPRSHVFLNGKRETKYESKDRKNLATKPKENTPTAQRLRGRELPQCIPSANLNSD